VYPYIEIDGKTHDEMSRRFSFNEKSAQQDAAFSRPPAPAM